MPVEDCRCGKEAICIDRCNSGLWSAFQQNLCTIAISLYFLMVLKLKALCFHVYLFLQNATRRLCK